jgi:hypothetical protein
MMKDPASKAGDIVARPFASSYRFQDTVKDLADCYENLDAPLGDNDLERAARDRLVKLCRQIADAVEHDPFPSVEDEEIES